MVDQQWERRPDGTPVRVLRDGATGRKWRVWVADMRTVPGARAEACLVFDTGDRVRRVWHVPDDWVRMAPDALARLAEHPREAADAPALRRWPPPEGPRAAAS